jgi:gas vesicle protein
MSDDYRDLRDRGFAEARMRERRELEERDAEVARARRQRQREERREQYSAIDELRAELRTEIAAVQDDVAARYETLIKAAGQALGDTVSDMHDAIKKVQDELFGLVERRFGELIGRIDAIVPGEHSRSKDFKFAGERDAGSDPVDLPNPLRRVN